MLTQFGLRGAYILCSVQGVAVYTEYSDVPGVSVTARMGVVAVHAAARRSATTIIWAFKIL